MAPSAKSPAEKLLDQAEAKLSSKGWLSFSSPKYEEAGDLYKEAANSFKLDKKFKEAGDAHAKEAECREKQDEKNEAAQAWWDAAKAYKRVDLPLAIQALSQTITFLTKQGRFRQAADREKDIAQIYWQELGDMRNACDSYVRAGEWYLQEEAKATANSCFKDAADLHAQLGEYPQAVFRYEQVASESLNSALTKYSVREYWLRASLCVLAMNNPGLAQSNLSKYIALEPSFAASRETAFIKALIEAVTRGDLEGFTAAVYDFDQVTKLDNWKTNILLAIKRGLQEEPSIL